MRTASTIGASVLCAACAAAIATPTALGQTALAVSREISVLLRRTDFLVGDTTSVSREVSLRFTLCYPNCDASVTAPFLNVNDFECFLNRFAASDAYTNCDGSTVPPVLNVNDFQCFLNAYAAGCS
jgi:hypothetical protein